MHQVKRRTKIVSTLGPSTATPDTIEEILLAGVNVVRLNFSHGSAEEHKNRASIVRELSAKHKLNVAILADLQGPKIRIGRFKEGTVQLNSGQSFCLDADFDSAAGTDKCVGIDYKTLPSDCDAGDMLLLDDGKIVLTVSEISGNKVHCTVDIGGKLSNNKGINKKGGGLSADALTEKDKIDIKTAAAIDVDYIAVSFPRYADDMHYARKLIREAGSHAEVIAKIERAETVASDETLDDIIIASDAVMVARGDLGVEIGDAELIGVQKQIINRARTLDRVVIVATQMMESMIHNPMPTRAEVFDVANAVLDGTDAVMLSGETAAGDYPCEVVSTVARVCIGAEKHPIVLRSSHRLDREFTRTNDSIAMATMYTANHLNGVKAIICLTESGSTPLLMSRMRSGIPIYALTPHPKTQRKTALYRGVESILFDPTTLKPDEINDKAIHELRTLKVIQEGDFVILTKGCKMGELGKTNSMQILKVSV
ncbi:MAG: pyruvate kinase [Pseudomonadales bacterium]|nr:pyruvate kinase [Pseudomonadales bacterium]